MIDNFEQIKGLMTFENDNDFYFLQVIQRKKDHKDSPYKLSCSNNNRLIKAYYIHNVEQLDKYKLEIIELCTLFTARAGIALNRRNSKKLSFEMLKLLATNISCDHFDQLGGLWNTVCGQHFSDKDKKWLIDIDDKSYDSTEMETLIFNSQPEGQKVVAKIPTKNGYHIITRPFDMRDFSKVYDTSDEYQIHKDNPTILYIP